MYGTNSFIFGRQGTSENNRSLGSSGNQSSGNYFSQGHRQNLGTYRLTQKNLNDPPSNLILQAVNCWKECPPASIVSRENTLHLTMIQLRVEDYYLIRSRKLEGDHPNHLLKAIREEKYNDELNKCQCYKIMPFSKLPIIDVNAAIRQELQNKRSNSNNQYQNRNFCNNTSQGGGSFFSSSNQSNNSYSNTSQTNNIFSTNNSPSQTGNFFSSNNSNNQTSIYGRNNSIQGGNIFNNNSPIKTLLAPNSNPTPNNNTNTNTSYSYTFNPTNPNGNSTSNNLFSNSGGTQNSSSNANSNNIFANTNNNNQNKSNCFSNNGNNTNNGPSNSTFNNNFFNANNRNTANTNETSSNPNIAASLFNNNSNPQPASLVSSLRQNTNPNNNKSTLQNNANLSSNTLFQYNSNNLTLPFNNQQKSFNPPTMFNQSSIQLLASQAMIFDGIVKEIQKRVIERLTPAQRSQKNAYYSNDSPNEPQYCSRKDQGSDQPFFSMTFARNKYQDQNANVAVVYKKNPAESNIFTNPFKKPQTNIFKTSINQGSKMLPIQSKIKNEDNHFKSIKISKSLSNKKYESILVHDFLTDSKDSQCFCSVKFQIKWMDRLKDLPTDKTIISKEDINLPFSDFTREQNLTLLVECLKEHFPIVRSDAKLLINFQASSIGNESNIRLVGMMEQYLINLDPRQYQIFYSSIKKDLIYNFTITKRNKSTQGASISWNKPVSYLTLDFSVPGCFNLELSEVVCTLPALNSRCRITFETLPPKIRQIFNQVGKNAATESLKKFIEGKNKEEARFELCCIHEDGSWTLTVDKFN